jgi:thiol:disulfide interchange protein DsbA
MKRIIWISVLGAAMLVAAGCSKEETAPVEQAPVVEAQEATESVSDVSESSVPETEAQTVVVEESAAEAEPEDQAIVLAQAEDIATARNWQFREGQNYTRMIPTQRTVGDADKIEVAELFMYSCPHCYDLEAYVNRWAETKDPGVRLVRIPAIFNNLAKLHAQLYYTEVFLAKTGKLNDPIAFRNMVFEEYHRKGNRLTSQTAIQRLFTRAGVSEDDFSRTWNSFEVNQALRVAADLARRYNVTSVPMIVVNGKYRTDVGQAGSYPKLIELIDELTVREGLR